MIDLITLMDTINAILLVLGGAGIIYYILYGPRPPPKKRL